MVFITIDSNAQIEGFYPISNKYIITDAYNPFGLFCSIDNSTPVRDSISISSLSGEDLLFEDSLGKQHVIESCYFIIIDSSEEYSYELWQIYGNTGKKFIIPFDTYHIFPDSNFYCQFHLQLLVKKDNESVDSSSHNFEMWFVQSIKSEHSTLNKPDFIIQTSNFNSSLIPISYTLTEPSLVNLTVYSCKGRIIKNLVDDVKRAGNHQVDFNCRSISNGTYFVHLRVGKNSVVEKMVVVR